MKTSSDVLDAINELERRFPVAAWRAGDIDLWPTYRFRLYGNAIDAQLIGASPRGLPQRLRQLTDRASRALWRVPRAALLDRARNASFSVGSTALFLSDGVSFVNLGDVWFDRVIDPVMQALDARGLRSLKLTPLAEAHVPRYMPSRFIQPTIDRVKLMGSRPRRDVVLPEFEAFHAAARRTFGARAPSSEWLQVQAARLEALAGWFGRVLDRCGASHVFVNTYYSLEGLALMQAARRRALCSIDLQHGMQGQYHVAYASWMSPPSAGYSTLPDEFWVWSHHEAAVIAEWSEGCATHRAHVSGNFWLRQWSEAKDSLIADYISRARSLRGVPPAKTQVLACLTWGVAEEENMKLMEAARLCDSSVAWWWRLHPVQSRQRAEFAARLERYGLDGSRVAEATDFPLYALVRAADLVVAHSSTVIQEAAELGVPSVITSDYGANLHASLVRQGVAVHATDGRAIADAVMARSPRPCMQMRDTPAEAHSLQALIDMAFAKGSAVA
jgi:hypothetical protein